MTGYDFLQTAQSYQNGFVNGFVRGIYMTCVDHLEKTNQICSFDSVLKTTLEMTPEQILSIFLSNLRNSTELQKREISELFTDCLKEAEKKPNIPSTPVDKR
jgi:hypothetical protein